MNALAMAASYDLNPSQFLGLRLPVTFDTCEVVPERWANWMSHDPVIAVDLYADNLRRLKALYRSCPLAWCKSLRHHYASRRVRLGCQSAMVGRLTGPSSLSAVMVSRVM